MPMESSAFPDMPRNCTDERSGRTRFASPPCSAAARVREETRLDRFMIGRFLACLVRAVDAAEWAKCPDFGGPRY
jgi:hypothetical protein